MNTIQEISTDDCKQSWKEIHELSSATLNDLFNNKIACIRVKEFVSPKNCALLSESIERQLPFSVYSGHNSDSGLSKFGPIQCEYSYASREVYFQKAKINHESLLSLNLPFYPLEEVAQAISEVSRSAGVEVAHDYEYGRYFAGVFHRMKDIGMLLHMDYAPFDAAQWTIGSIESQISWVLHLKAPLSGGRTEVFRQSWQNQDELMFRIPRSYHYQDEVIRKATCSIADFKVGDLVFFNSRNYHRVETCLGTRMTVGSFVGRRAHGPLVLWS